MKKIVFAVIMLWLGFEFPASASEFQEKAMCTALNSGAAFPHITVQAEPSKPTRGLLILTADDGLTQVYSGPLKKTADGLEFREDTKIVSATFLKANFTAAISFNGDSYKCDERSFESN